MSDGSSGREAHLMFGRRLVRGMLLVVLLVAVALAIMPTAALAQNAAPAKVQRAADRAYAKKEAAKLDCSDIATQRGAQALFSLSSEDRFKLDGDSDGMACETKRGSKVAEDGSRLGADTGGDRDCVDFSSQKAAQAQLRADPSDPYNLDPDTNGIACDITAAPYKNSASDKTPVAQARSNADLDCKDFEYQHEAQVVYLRDKSDPNGLDSKKEDGKELAGNGFACDNMPYLASNVMEVRAGVASTEAANADTASSTPMALIQAWPHGGGFGLLLDLVALFMVFSGVMTLIVVRKR